MGIPLPERLVKDDKTFYIGDLCNTAMIWTLNFVLIMSFGIAQGGISSPANWRTR